MNPSCVAVVGAGVMGADLALDLSQHGYTVLLKDLSEAELDVARARIEQQYKLVRLMKKAHSSASLQEVMAKITLTTSYEGFENVSIVIENVRESLPTKEAVYRELAEICADDVLYGVNTSCISITRLARGLPKPEQVIGMHFLNPVPLKNLVEVIRGQHTSDDTVAQTKAFLKSLGKRCVVVQDYPGFVTNRILMLTINESAWVVQDGVASASDVDTIFKAGFAHKMGPLATADLIGLDTILDSLVVLYESYGDPKFRPCPLLRRMVDAGWLGRKSGRGFFKYGVSSSA